jgi:hypothetical protein
MMKHAFVLGLVAFSAGACATEHRTVVVASDDACARYGFTASTADYVRCQQSIAEQRRVRIVPGYPQAQLIADSQAACAAYGVPPNSAQYDRCVQDEFAARRPG